MAHKLGNYTRGCRCADCLRAQKDYYKDNQERLLEYAKQRREYRKRLLRYLKQRRSCADCGYNEHPDALDFDHVRGTKRDNISNLVLASRERLLEELRKCEVRCANCHRVRSGHE